MPDMCIRAASARRRASRHKHRALLAQRTHLRVNERRGAGAFWRGMRASSVRKYEEEGGNQTENRRENIGKSANKAGDQA